MNGSDECSINERLDALDISGDGTISVEEIQTALRDRLGYSVDDREKSLAEFVHAFADMTGDGQVTRKDLELFCQDLDDLYKRDQWRLGPNKHIEAETTLQGTIL
jgi:Ca2+-binding EF-hand superfamily protein